MMESMQTPMTRAEFERNFHLLREQLRQGKMHVNKGLEGIILGLEEVRFLPNGRIDFLSVNELARLNANMTAHFNTERIKTMIDNQEKPKGSAPEHRGEEPV